MSAATRTRRRLPSRALVQAAHMPLAELGGFRDYPTAVQVATIRSHITGVRHRVTSHQWPDGHRTWNIAHAVARFTNYAHGLTG